jgi:hypothetical protein
MCANPCEYVPLLIAAPTLIPNGLFMQDLIDTIVANTGLERPKAERAVGILLNLVATQGDKVKVDLLFEKMPGARELVMTHGGDGAGGGGLMGILAGGMMGGPLAMITKLQATGLSVDQIKQVGTLTLDHAKKVAGADALRAAAGNIPGLSSYI